MNIKEEKMCRLCLTAPEDGYEEIDSITKDMINFLKIKMNWHVIKDPIICSACAETIKKSYCFKSDCMDSENLILSYIVDENETEIDLKHVYRENTSEIDSREDYDVCRFCINRIETSSGSATNTRLSEVKLVDMLAECFDEMDFKIVKDPKICTECRYNLEKFLNFIANCKLLENQINDCCQKEGTNSKGQVSLGAVLQYSLKYTPQSTIKQEMVTFNCTENADLVDNSVKYENIKIEEVKNNELERRENIPKKIAKIPKKFKIYQCPFCDFQTKHSGSIINHKLRHKDVTELKMFKCDDCDFETKYKGHLKEHVLIHVDANRFKCEHCNFQTHLKNRLNDHLLTHKDTPEVRTFKCKVCTYTAKRKSNLKAHELTHKDALEEDLFSCPVCEYTTNRKFHIGRHLLTHKNENKIYRCRLCDFEAKGMFAIRKHSVLHKLDDSTEILRCPQCLYETNQRGHYNRHLLTHDTVEMAYKCNDCNFETHSKHLLLKHERENEHVVQIERFICTICGFTARSKGHLYIHRRSHKDPPQAVVKKLYPCTVCGYEAKRKDYLDKHMFTHRDVLKGESYSCESCKYTTDRKDCLKRHLQRHEDEKNGVVYACDQCKFVASSKYLLTQHGLTHKDQSEVMVHRCEECDYTTNVKSRFNRHMQTHCNSKDVLRCGSCDYSTNRKDLLKRHLYSNKHHSEIYGFDTSSDDDKRDVI